MDNKVNENIPFDSDLSIKNVKNSNEKLSKITNKHIYDKSGNKVATFDSTSVSVDQATGKNVKVHSYKSKDSTYELIDDVIYKNGKPVGKTKFKRKIYVTITIVVSIILLLLSLFFIILQLIQTPVVVKISVYDKNGSWEEQTKIGVFDSKIKPGSEGEYEFYVINESNIALSYSFTIKEMYNYFELDNFPIQYKVLLENKEMTGWTKGTELEIKDIKAEPEERHNFTLKWRWLFESGNDTLDTYFGNSGGSYSIYLNVAATSIEE